MCVCVFTHSIREWNVPGKYGPHGEFFASTEWNVPGKYGPHGELFFFLIQEELATMPGSETFSPFFAADIRTPLFLC